MFRFCLVVLVLFVSGCATTLETVYVPADNSGWKVGYGVNKPELTIVEYIPVEESISNWSRIFTIQFLEGVRELSNETPKTLSKMLTNCPDTKWDVLSEDKLSVTYERKTLACKGGDEYEIARLLKGNDGIHRISYTSKKPINETDRASWLKVFTDAYVEKSGQRVIVNP
jgi:hypothetical protein